ncbi:MAG: dienelactone hydrolase family protein [Betaproteobacteria bacterium]
MKQRFSRRLIDFMLHFSRIGMRLPKKRLSLMVCCLILWSPIAAYSKDSSTESDLRQIVETSEVRSLAVAEHKDQAREIKIPVSHGPSDHIKAWWWPAAGVAATHQPAEKRPVVVLLHGCGGMLNRQAKPDQRITSYAGLLRDKGWHVIALDSFSTRGVREICTRPRGDQAIVNQTQRRADVSAAIAWLGEQDAIDRHRIGLIGWSNGGSTVLEYTHRGDAEMRKAGYPGLRAAAAFYPGCAYRQQHGYQPAMPVLLLLGLSDDWTSPEPCLKLASDNVEIKGWEHAFHGFDGTATLRFRTDIRTGTNPEGVHQGANLEAGRQAKNILFSFLEKHFSIQ